MGGRVPALPNWRTFYRGARFSEFALTGGLDWYSAMLQLYPPDVLVTPTRVLPPTITTATLPPPTPSPTEHRSTLPHPATKYHHRDAIGHAIAFTTPPTVIP
jgi:TolB protein